MKMVMGVDGEWKKERKTFNQPLNSDKNCDKLSLQTDRHIRTLIEYVRY